MKFEDLVKAQDLAASLTSIWELQKSLELDFSNTTKVTFVFQDEDGKELSYDGIELNYAKYAVNLLESTLKNQLNLLGITFKSNASDVTSGE
jgi:hypothetical protein